MKTSVIEVRDMLSVLSVLGVEKKIGEVPGVESVTVNFAAGNATVRYDESRLNIADIRSDVRQSAYESAASAGAGHKGHAAPAAPSATPVAAGPNSAKDTSATAPAGATTPGDRKQDKAASGADTANTAAAAPKPSPTTAPTSAAPKSAPNAAATAPAGGAPAGDGKQDNKS